jgi:hypothetical protein
MGMKRFLPSPALVGAVLGVVLLPLQATRRLIMPPPASAAGEK